MKTKLLTLVFLAAFMCFNLPAPTQAAPSTDAAIEMLKEFYTKYITANARTGVSAKKLNAIRKQYCTTGLLTKIQDLELDHDPFLNGHEADEDWVKTLSVSKAADKTKGLYIVSFSVDESQPKTNIKLLVVKEGERYKIDGIATN